ncbi:MAG: protein kinase [Acidobacteriaceae bacterium]|jgi:serine/threonine protein kinase
MTGAILALPSIELEWNGSRDATQPMRMRVGAHIHADPRAQSAGLDNSGIFPSFSIASYSGEFEIGCGASKGKIRPLLKEATISRDAALDVLQQLGEGLDLLHSRDIVHGFLRIETLLVDEKGRVFVPDWFLRWDSAQLDQLAAQLPQITPEFLRQEELTPAADQFLLACIAYRLLYGVFPFQAATRVEQLLRIGCGMWAENPPMEPDIGVCDVWDRVFSLQPEWRFPSCLSFVDALRAAFLSSTAAESSGEGAFASDQEEPTIDKRGNVLIWAAAGILAIASVGLGAWSASLSRQVQSETYQLQSEADPDAAASAPLGNGILNVCNSSSIPLQITEVAAIYRKGDSLQEFDSSDHSSARWAIAPASKQSLSFAENGGVLWDGSTLFYYLGYQIGDDFYVSTGLWDKVDGCLELAPH